MARGSLNDTATSLGARLADGDLRLRLQMTGATGIGVWSAALVFGRLQQALDPSLASGFARIAEPLCLLEIALCGLVVLLARRLPPETPGLLDLGYLVNWVAALAVELVMGAVELPVNAMRGTPWAVLFILFVPLYLPRGLRATLGWCLAFATTPLIAVWMHWEWFGTPMPLAVTLVQWSMGPLFAVGMVMVPVWLQTRQRERLEAAEARIRQLGSYELGRSLGQGGMGEVWEAWHELLPRPAAVKIIRADPSDRERAAARFRAEAQAMSGLQSPHTVELYDFGVSPDGRFFYAMERLEGADLRRIVRDTGPLPPERVVHLLVQVCRSLEEAHARRLVHGDVKPANLFACHYAMAWDFLKVLDFGLVLRDPEGRGRIAGTPGYLAPELWDGGDATPRSDLYALGCTAWELLVGERLFEGTSQSLIEEAHREKQPDWDALPELPEGLRSLLADLLAKSPADRPLSAREVERRLSDIALDEPWTEERARLWWVAHDSLVITDTREYEVDTWVFEVR
ncbi:MAG: serine/threonine protein kinase [Deltaproteobacteria bacterium]|nr:MAG: serine/threonine protein kinase [Deltaproteobacteria bacterium]